MAASIGGVLSVSGVRKIETPLKESRQNYSISVDSNGIMRRTDNGAEDKRRIGCIELILIFLTFLKGLPRQGR